MDPRLFALGALLCLTAPAAGQGRTWIVDGNNGPGTNFLDIPPAVAAAQDGDTILVRPFGSFLLAYRGAVITKAIRLISEGGTGAATLITSPASTQGYLVIKEIPANKTVVVEGVGTSFFLPATDDFIVVTNCAGNVHLDSISVTTDALSGGIGFSIGNSAHVTVHRSSAFGNPMQVFQSNVSITDSSLTGRSGSSGPGGGVTTAVFGMLASNSNITLSRTSVTGGNGGQGMFLNEKPQPAIVMTGGALTIAGPVGTSVAAGQTGGVQTPTSAITGAGGTVTADPRVALRSAFGAPAVAVGHTLTTVPLPCVSADVSAQTQQLSVDLLATAGDLAQIYASLPFGPVPAPPPIAGEIRVNLGAALVLGAFVIPASEHVSLAFPFMPDPALLGLPLTFQALVLTPGVSFRFSTAATPVWN